MNGTTDRCKTVYPQLFQSGDIKIHYSKYGKKIRQIQGRISMKRLVHDPSIQYIIINLLTKYDYSSLHGFTAIFDEKFHYSKYGKEKHWTNTRRISIRRLVCNLTTQFIIINLHTKYDNSSLHSFTEIFDEKFHYSKYGKKDKSSTERGNIRPLGFLL